MSELTSAVTGRDGGDVPLAKILDILTAYDDIRVLAKDVHEVSGPKRQVRELHLHTPLPLDG